MDINRYFQEITRIVKPFHIEAEGIKENGALHFSFGGDPLFHVASDGACYYRPEHLDTHEKRKLCELVAEIAEQAKVYVNEMENAALLKVVDLREGYKLLCEYGNTVLAGKDMGEHGYQFTTWNYTYDRKGVTLGRNYINNYTGAKEDFAVRSGLINERRFLRDDLQAAQPQKPVFCVRIMAGDIENDILKVQKDADGELLIHELMLPATDEELQAAYAFRAKNETCYQTVQGIRYSLPVGAMAVADLNSLNDSAAMIDRMSDMEIADLWLSLTTEFLKDENELKEICEAVLGPSAALTMATFSEWIVSTKL